jgi:hypothetical protein
MLFSSCLLNKNKTRFNITSKGRLFYVGFQLVEAKKRKKYYVLGGRGAPSFDFSCYEI